MECAARDRRRAREREGHVGVRRLGRPLRQRLTSTDSAADTALAATATGKRSSPWHDAIVRVMRLEHVQLAMPAGREPEAIAFYDHLLGIPHVPKPPHLAVRGGCWFERDDLKVHLGVDKEFRPATKAHPAFIVDDVRALAAALAAAGHVVVDDEPLEGYDRVYVDDPFGNRIELMEPRA